MYNNQIICLKDQHVRNLGESFPVWMVLILFSFLFYTSVTPYWLLWSPFWFSDVTEANFTLTFPVWDLCVPVSQMSGGTEIWNAFVENSRFYWQLMWLHFERSWIKQKRVIWYECIIGVFIAFRKGVWRDWFCTGATIWKRMLCSCNDALQYLEHWAGGCRCWYHLLLLWQLRLIRVCIHFCREQNHSAECQARWTQNHCWGVCWIVFSVRWKMGSK